MKIFEFNDYINILENFHELEYEEFFNDNEFALKVKWVSHVTQGIKILDDVIHPRFSSISFYRILIRLQSAGILE